VSSVPAIIDLVCAGYGRAVLTASAAQASGRGAELAVRPIVEPSVVSVICLATSASRLPTPVMRHAAVLLTDLVRALPQADGAQAQNAAP
jgi:LysR family nitrogen assimilation transcriptional regulator